MYNTSFPFFPSFFLILSGYDTAQNVLADVDFLIDFFFCVACSLDYSLSRFCLRSGGFDGWANVCLSVCLWMHRLVKNSKVLKPCGHNSRGLWERIRMSRKLRMWGRGRIHAWVGEAIRGRGGLHVDM